GLGAGVILPKRLLTAALSSSTGTRDYDHLLMDSYESPVYSQALASDVSELHRLGEILKLSVDDFTKLARNVRSPDELSVFVAHQLMRQLAPSLLWITLHDMDIAHSGTFSLYVDGIRRSDELCGDIWKMIQ